MRRARGESGSATWGMPPTPSCVSSAPGDLLGRMRSLLRPFPPPFPAEKRRSLELPGGPPGSAREYGSFVEPQRPQKSLPTSSPSEGLSSWPGRTDGEGWPERGCRDRAAWELVPSARSRRPRNDLETLGSLCQHTHPPHASFPTPLNARSGEMGPSFEKPASVRRGKFAKVLLFDVPGGWGKGADTAWISYPRRHSRRSLGG